MCKNIELILLYAIKFCWKNSIVWLHFNLYRVIHFVVSKVTVNKLQIFCSWHLFLYCKVWNTTSLNDLNAKCWSIDPFQAISNKFWHIFGGISAKSWRFTCINTVFHIVPQKKSNGDKSHDFGVHLILSRRDYYVARKPYSLELCGISHHLVETIYFPSRILQ